MPEDQKPQKENIRVILDKPKANEIALRSAGSSKKVSIPVSVTEKAHATAAVTKLAAMILDKLVNESEDEMMGNPLVSQMILQGGGRIMGIEVTGLKFKVLYAVKEGGSYMHGYTKIEVK